MWRLSTPLCAIGKWSVYSAVTVYMYGTPVPAVVVLERKHVCLQLDTYHHSMCMVKAVPAVNTAR